MSLGFNFIVLDNDFTLEFSLSNTTEQSVLHHSEWRTFGESPDSIPEEQRQFWTVDLHKKHLEYIRNNNVKQANEIKGVVSEHIWDFI
jgi:hypothetical protein